MQTSKIKIGETYALPRGQGLVRFHVTEIVTRRTSDGPATNEIKGYVVEDRKPGSSPPDWKVEPADLLGPYDEQAELVERKKQEDAEREVKAKEREKQARRDRLALYAFVRAEAPKNPKDYHQMFSITFSSVEIRSEGKQAIIDRIHEMQAIGAAGGGNLRVVEG